MPINISESPPIVQTEPLTPFIDTPFGNNKLNNATCACSRFAIYSDYCRYVYDC